MGDADRAPRGTVTCSSLEGDEGVGGTDPLPARCPHSTTPGFVDKMLHTEKIQVWRSSRVFRKKSRKSLFFQAGYSGHALHSYSTLGCDHVSHIKIIITHQLPAVGYREHVRVTISCNRGLRHPHFLACLASYFPEFSTPVTNSQINHLKPHGANPAYVEAAYVQLQT